MATFVLLPGAGCSPWYWTPLADELSSRGHVAIPVDLPCDDDSADLEDYADTVVQAIRASTASQPDPASHSGRGLAGDGLLGDGGGAVGGGGGLEPEDLVLVAHSLGGFTAPLVCARLSVKLMVLVSGMIPRPGEAPGDWWANTGYEGPGGSDLMEIFFHDVPPELAATAMKTVRDQSSTPLERPWPLPMWPAIPTKFVLCRNDRFFPAAFMRRVVADRLGVTPDEIDAGHMPMLARPKELADRLESYLNSTGTLNPS
jgi:pimeloyl-ACP methyl ester carboxylesterase